MGSNGYIAKYMGSKPNKTPGLVLTKSREPKPDGNRRQRRAFASISRKGGSLSESAYTESDHFSPGGNTVNRIKGRG